MDWKLKKATFKSEITTPLVMKLIAVIGGVIAAVLFFFAVIFALASSVQATTSRLAISIILFAVGLAIIAGIYYVTRKPKTVIQRLELSGEMKAAQIRCPNCSGVADMNQIKIVSGVPYIKCAYCGNMFEVVEEPKW